MTSCENINLFKNESNSNNNDICSICHENLNTEQTFEIPECKHVFHSNCLIQWFRTGQCRCPYCNSTYNNEKSNWKESRIKYKIISAYCRRKNANEEIIKKVEYIRKLDERVKDITKDIQNIKSQIGEYKIIKKNVNILNNKRWQVKRKIREKKDELLYSVNIIPFYINKK
jgi:hypothetical protein